MLGLKLKSKFSREARFPEIGGLAAPRKDALVTYVDFVLQEEFEELGIGESIGFGFLQAQFQAVKQSGKMQVLDVLFESVSHHFGMGWWWLTKSEQVFRSRTRGWLWAKLKAVCSDCSPISRRTSLSR